MITFATITKWESHRDSKGRVSASERTLGREYLINTNRISDLVSTGATTCKFRFIENWDARREGWDYMEANESVAALRTGHDLVPVSKFMTLPIFIKNNPARATVNTTIEVDDFVYATANNANTATSWVVYIREGFARIEVLVNLTLTQIYNLVGAPLLDYDGNIYTTAIIGSQEWIVPSLRTIHYADGTVIPTIVDNATWLADTTGAYCWYDFDIGFRDVYGALYTWYAATNAHGLAYFTRNGIQEAGWRVPTRVDCHLLRDTIGTYFTAGGFLKEIGITHWDTPNTGATDTYGYQARGSGNRFVDSDDLPTNGFANMGVYDDFWTTDEFNVTDGLSQYMAFDTAWYYDYVHEKFGGMAVRCVRDL